MHVAASMRLATRTNGSPMRARRTRAHVLRPCARARVCVCDRAPTHPAPTHASAFRPRGPYVARLGGGLAGVRLCVGVQREHRRVEHRVGHHVVRGMRRLFGPGGAPPQAGRAPAGCSMRRGPLCAAATADVLARVCAEPCGHAHARVSPCAGIAARSKDGLYACVYMYLHIYYKYV
jgi:hypothetical protein